MSSRITSPSRKKVWRASKPYCSGSTWRGRRGSTAPPGGGGAASLPAHAVERGERAGAVGRRDRGVVAQLAAFFGGNQGGAGLVGCGGEGAVDRRCAGGPPRERPCLDALAAAAAAEEP